MQSLLKMSHGCTRSTRGGEVLRGEAEKPAVMATAQENVMRPLLALSAGIDWLNEKIGNVCNWLVLAACVVSAANAMIRYAFGYSSNGWLELQWYMFAVLVMFGASYTFKRMSMSGSKSSI